MYVGELVGVMGSETETVTIVESVGTTDVLTLKVGDSVLEIDSVPELLKDVESVPLTVTVGENEVCVVADADTLDVVETLKVNDTVGVIDTDEHAVCEIEVAAERVPGGENDLDVVTLNVEVKVAADD